MRPVAWLIVALVAVPVAAGAREGEYDPCKNRGNRRIAVVYARSSGGLLGGDGECKGNVYPSKKTVCVGDTVTWSVINSCDVEEVADIRVEGLERVVDRCTVVRQLGVGAARELRCRVRRGLREDVKQEYEVRGRIGRSRTIIDPELEIRTPR